MRCFHRFLSHKDAYMLVTTCKTTLESVAIKEDGRTYWESVAKGYWKFLLQILYTWRYECGVVYGPSMRKIGTPGLAARISIDYVTDTLRSPRKVYSILLDTPKPHNVYEARKSVNYLQNSAIASDLYAHDPIFPLIEPDTTTIFQGYYHATHQLILKKYMYDDTDSEIQLACRVLNGTQKGTYWDSDKNPRFTSIRFAMEVVESEASTSLLYNWKTFTVNECMYGCVSRGFLTDFMKRHADNAFNVMANEAKGTLSEQYSVFEVIYPVYCLGCKNYVMSRCSCGPINRNEGLRTGQYVFSSPNRYKLILQVCESPINENIERVYLRDCEDVDQPFIRAASPRQGNWSMAVTDGESRVYINVQDAYFKNMLDHAGNVNSRFNYPGNPLTGALVAVTLREHDINGVFCQNIVRENEDQTADFIPGPFQAWSFVAEEIEFVSWHHCMLPKRWREVFSPIEVWADYLDNPGWSADEDTLSVGYASSLPGNTQPSSPVWGED